MGKLGMGVLCRSSRPSHLTRVEMRVYGSDQWGVIRDYVWGFVSSRS
jgi:hypothetical protein